MQNISRENLNSTIIQNQIKDMIQELDDFGYTAGNISEKLDIHNQLKEVFSDPDSLKNSQPDVYSNFWPLYIKLWTHLLQVMDEEEILMMFEKYYLDIIKSGVDYKNNLRTWLMQKPYKKRDDILDKVRQALQKNNQKLGSTISIGTSSAPIKASIKNWLIDYNNVLGRDRHLKMDIADYIFKNKNASALKKEDREILMEIFEFYEKLKLKVNEPFSLSSYPLSYVGVDVVGEEGSLRTRFKPRNEEEQIDQTPEEIEKPRGGEPKMDSEMDLSKEAEEQLNKPSQDTGVVDLKNNQPATPQSSQTPAKKEIKFTLENIDSVRKITPQIFRRISSDPNQAAEKIKSEIMRLIAKDPGAKETVRENWQMSELYKLYIDIGREGMNTGLPVGKVISARKQIGKIHLNEDEFKAVVELSKVF